MIDICEQVAESLSAFQEAEAAGAAGASSTVGLDRVSVEAHLRVCTYCGSLRPARSATPKSGQVPPPPPRVWEGIESVLREEGLIRE